MAKGQNEDVNAEEAVNDSSPRVYELGFHIDPELPTEEVKKIFGEIRDIIAEKGGIIAEEEPVSIPLAYTISRQQTSGRRDFNSAFFSWVVYETDAANHTDILKVVGADARIIRFIDLITTKEAARHASELREMALKVPEKPVDAEAVAGAELDATRRDVTGTARRPWTGR